MYITKNIPDFVLLAVVIIAVVVLGNTLRPSSLYAVNGAFDDFVYISVANSIKEGRGFFIDYAPLWHWDNLPSNELIKEFPDIAFPEDIHGAIYYLLLSGAFYVSNAEPEQYSQIGSFLSSAIIGVFLCVYYLFCRKYFTQNVAFFSTFIIGLSSIFLWYSVRTVSYPLVFLFIISALMFLGKTKKQYIMFGLFAGLATLTHPIGIIVGLAYVIFSLRKHQTKGALIVLGITSLVILPWMIRNYLVFGTFSSLGKGLALPTDWIGNIIEHETKSFPTIDKLNPYTIFDDTFINSIKFYHLELVIILAILSMILIGIIFSGRLLHSNSKLHCRLNIGAKRSRIMRFTSYFAICNITLMFIFGIMAGYDPEITYLLPTLFLLVPTSIFIIEKVVIKYTEKNNQTKIPHVFITISILIIPCIIFFSSMGNENILAYNSDTDLFDNAKGEIFLSQLSSVPKDSVIMTDWPSLVSTKTGLLAIGIPADYTTTTSMKTYLVHYKPDYLVLYNDTIKQTGFSEQSEYTFTRLYADKAVYRQNLTSTIYLID